MGYTAKKDYKTSKGNVAPDMHWSGTDDMYDARAKYKQAVEKDYRPAKVVRPSTRKYNCHAYGHANRHAWFNDIKRFIEDDYFPYTPGTLQVDDIVIYVKNNQITHSAKISSLNGNRIKKLRSKWGAWPEVEHGKSNVPDIYGSIVYYLRKRNSLLEEIPDYIEYEGQERIDDLVESLLDEEIRFKVMQASTPEVALRVIRELPEVTELSLYGDYATDRIVKALSGNFESDDDKLQLFVSLAQISTAKSKIALGNAATEIKFASDKELGFGELVLGVLISEVATLEDTYETKSFRKRILDNANKLKK